MPPSDVLLFGWLLFFQKIRHAVQTDAQRGRVVQQGGGGGLNDARHAQSDKHAVEADDERQRQLDRDRRQLESDQRRLDDSY